MTTLKDKEASEFLIQMLENENKKIGLTPTPNLEKIRERIIDDRIYFDNKEDIPKFLKELDEFKAESRKVKLLIK